MSPLDSATYFGLWPSLPRPVARAKSSLPGQWQKTWGKCKRPGKVWSLGPPVTYKIQKGMFKELWKTKRLSWTYQSRPLNAMGSRFLGFLRSHGFNGLWKRVFGQHWLGAVQMTIREPPANWSQFWENYQKVDPDFELFRIPNTDLSRTAAFLVHGDEGRTLKRNALMVTSLQSAWDVVMMSNGFRAKKLTLRTCGSTLQVIHLWPGMLWTQCQKHLTSLTPQFSMMPWGHVAKSLRKCFDEGCVDQVRGERFKIVVLGVKGDAPYLVKAAHFYRSYNTMAKRGDERGPPKGVCPYCLAGTNGFPAEDISTSSPCWLPTVGVKLPWLKRPAFIKHLLHNPSNPTEFFKSDIWHIVHLGFGRSWVASIVQTALPYLPCQNLEQKWEWLTDDYLRWCRTSKKQAHVSKITAYLMSYGDTTGAMGQWSKGALTTNLLQWLVDLLGKIPGDPDGLLAQCRAATYRLNSLFRLLYRSGAFSDSRASCIHFWSRIELPQDVCLDGSGHVQRGKTVAVPVVPQASRFFIISYWLLETWLHRLGCAVRQWCMAAKWTRML